MTTSPNRLTYFAGLLVLMASASSIAAPRFGRSPLGVCDLLREPNKYRNKVVVVRARAYLGDEYFTIQDYHCDGSIDITTGKGPPDHQKYRFLTKQDEKYREFMRRVDERWAIKIPAKWHCEFGEDCGPNKFRVTTTMRALFRCNIHPEDLAPCGNVSHGNSEIVIEKVTKVEAKSLPFPKDFPVPPADEPPKK